MMSARTLKTWSAIDDELVDEMSFAFMLRDGHWNDDFDRFTILEADINRGDVSAVNYGANPYTSIEARAGEWLKESERMPAVVARAALQRFAKRIDVMQLREDSPGALVAAIDATLDQACELVVGWDMSTLPPEVGQALTLMLAAEHVSDELMDMLGIFDPDEDESAEDAPATLAAPTKSVRSVVFAETYLNGI